MRNTVPTKQNINMFLVEYVVDKFGLYQKKVLLNPNQAGFMTNVVGLDSLDTIEMFIAFEKNFGIYVTDEDIELMQKYSLNQIVDFIHSKYVDTHKNKSVTSPQYSGVRIQKNGRPYCQLLGAQCKQPTRINYTTNPYCDFIGCKIYKNFQKLR